MFDLIGDIHGHSDALEALLERLGYREGASPRVGSGAIGARETASSSVACWRHPQRTAIFVGDFVDRGPGIARTIEIVRAMVQAGAARAVLGNHELNALAYATERGDGSGDFCRPHSERNRRIHAATLEQLSPRLRQEALEWFRRLPVALDLGDLRIVHACWDPAAITRLGSLIEREGGLLTTAAVQAMHRHGTAEFDAMETVLKGPEVALPAGLALPDHEGHLRRQIRARWFAPPTEWTYAAVVFPPAPDVPLIQIAPAERPKLPYYPADAPPVFFGHYWMPATETPSLLTPNVACLDWSIARGGRLVAYRWSGERTLDPSRLVWVQAARSAGDRPLRTMPT